MTQAEFIDAVFSQLGPENELPKSTIKAVLDATGAATLQALNEAGEAPAIGLGKFKLAERAARKGRNPRTGEEIDIPAARVVKFTPSKAVKEAF